jgi:hypothetical protein
MTLKWNRISDHCLESHDLCYYVTKYLQGGNPVYQAIRKPDVSLLVADNPDVCKAVCNDDLGTPYERQRMDRGDYE